jgi:general secretion pathway protein A
VYTQFFGLTEKPFSITPDPRYLYMSRRHADALAHLIYGISQSGGFIQLTGEVGTGKTTLVRSLLEQLPEEADVALILNPELTTQEFLTTIAEELNVELPTDGSTKSLVDRLSAHLLDAHARGRRTVLIVDEAQNLATDVLEQVRLLTNLETPKQKLLQIILIGQPELREVLDREDMRQLAQRVTGRYHLEPLSQDDTAKYLGHRMKVAGAPGAIFSKSAIREIFRWSKGVPRIINVIADRSLLAAYTRDTRTVDKSLVKRAASEVYGKRLVPIVERRLVAGIALAGIALLALGTWRSLNSDGSWIQTQFGRTPGFTLDISAIGGSSEVSLSALLADRTLPRGTDAAFETLFGIWGIQYLRGPDTACQQAERQYLRCWFQKGSLNHLKRLNRPAILSLIDERGEQYQVVMTALNAETAEFTISYLHGDIGGTLPVLVWRSPHAVETWYRRRRDPVTRNAGQRRQMAPGEPCFAPGRGASRAELRNLRSSASGTGAKLSARPSPHRRWYCRHADTDRHEYGVGDPRYSVSRRGSVTCLLFWTH